MARKAAAMPIAARRSLERNFYLFYAVFGWVGVLLGFIPAITQRLQGHADYPAPLILHAHAVLFTGWMVLLTVQILLVRNGNLALHRKLGLLGFGMVPLMFATGTIAEFYDLNTELVRVGANIDRERRFLAIPLYDMIVFPPLTLLGLAWRHDPAAHKRMMYLGTVPLLSAAWSRATNRLIVNALGLPQGSLRVFMGYFSIGIALLVLLLAFDRWLLGRPHRLSVIGAAVLAGSMALTACLYWTPWWPDIAATVARMTS